MQERRISKERWTTNCPSLRKKKDLHEKTVQELNREPKHGVVKVEKITVLKGRLDDLNAKQHSKENDLQMSMEEIDKIQSEIDSIKVSSLSRI